MKKIILIAFSLVFSFSVTKANAEVYGPYPITLKGYDGDKTNSVKFACVKRFCTRSLRAKVKLIIIV